MITNAPGTAPAVHRAAAEPWVVVAGGGSIPSPSATLSSQLGSVQSRDALSSFLQSLASGSPCKAPGFSETFTVIISFNFLVKS